MRVTRIVCDRCGGSAEVEPAHQEEGWFVAQYCRVFGSTNPSQDLHLCPACGSEFQAWMTRVSTEVVA